MTARVVATHGRHVVIEISPGKRLLGHLRGKKNDCVVGDRVRWQPAGDEAVVEAVEPRRNLLRRQDAFRTKSFAANLDQLLIVVAGEPVFSESQLARALIAAEDAGIPAYVLLNKTDLPSAEAARARLAPYRAMGYEVVETAIKAQPDATRQTLGPLLAGRISFVLGASGMGKSSLINLMAPAAAAQVGEISAALNAGRHTTTSTSWYWLDSEHTGALIDSPGFQEFGLMHIAPEELAALMPDLRPHLGGCRYYNCTHRHEPGCSVRAAAERGDIVATRINLYEAMRDELEAAPRR